MTALMTLITPVKRIPTTLLSPRNWPTPSQSQRRTTEQLARLLPRLLREHVGAFQRQLSRCLSNCLKKVMLIENLGGGVELRYPPGGQSVTSCDLVSNCASSTSQGDSHEQIEWFSPARLWQSDRKIKPLGWRPVKGSFLFEGG
mgnify:CR=1 FL=1